MTSVIDEDYERPFACFSAAIVGLEVAVENGEVWYEKAFAGARAGAKRCRQEVV